MEDEETIVQPGQDEGQPAAENKIDDWASAFEALAPKDEAAPEADAGDRGDGDEPEPGKPAASERAAGNEAGAEGEGKPVGVAPGVRGGEPAGDAGAGEGAGEQPEFAPGQIKQQVEGLRRGVEQQAMREVRDLFIQKNIRHDAKGRLGATINDKDIYKRDENGAPVFYNPDTGQPFTGDNPRAQARQWVQDYNDELKDTFNRMVQDRVDSLAQGIRPTVQMLEFLPTFEKLDTVRKQMLESLIEDYEVTDNEGNPIGYSCDLKKALAQVNRQIEAIRKTGAPAPAAQAAAPAKQKTSPVTDMRTGASASGAEKPRFKSIAEAMEWEQDQLLAKAKKGKR